MNNRTPPPLRPPPDRISHLQRTQPGSITLRILAAGGGEQRRGSFCTPRRLTLTFRSTHDTAVERSRIRQAPPRRRRHRPPPHPQHPTSPSLSVVAVPSRRLRRRRGRRRGRRGAALLLRRGGGGRLRRRRPRACRTPA